MLKTIKRIRGRSRQLERSCQDKIARLDLPAPFRLRELAARLEEQRGRELWVLGSKVLPAEITGLWVGTVTRDYVFYRARLDGCRRDTTILHEFAHIICDHRSARVADEAWLAERFPWLGGLGEVEHMCMRTDYGTAEEHEAELIASLILVREDVGQRRPPAGLPSEEQRARHRLEGIWGA
ncbi:MAG: hypothetical protein ABJC62_05955 [Frankiaceae bacterium]